MRFFIFCIYVFFILELIFFIIYKFNFVIIYLFFLIYEFLDAFNFAFRKIILTTKWQQHYSICVRSNIKITHKTSALLVHADIKICIFFAEQINGTSFSYHNPLSGRILTIL